jgi:hypothetical protein
MAVDEQEAFEAVLHQRRHHVAHHGNQRRWSQRDGAGEAQMVLRHADGERWRHQRADLVTHAFGDELRVEMVGADQTVRPVLFGGADRDDDGARGPQIFLDLMPGGQRELHRFSPDVGLILQSCRFSRKSLLRRTVSDQLPMTCSDHVPFLCADAAGARAARMVRPLLPAYRPRGRTP